jgi:hypothetical protein
VANDGWDGWNMGNDWWTNFSRDFVDCFLGWRLKFEVIGIFE